MTVKVHQKRQATVDSTTLTIDMYASTGAKKGTLMLPASLFGVLVNEGLMHQVLVLQQSNRRAPIAHAKSRGEVRGSTRKLFQQKGTGRARRGSIRSPLLRGGGKAFGPRNVRNFTKGMPRKMRRAALRSCLSLQAQRKGIIGLEEYAGGMKTKQTFEFLKKLPVELGRRILMITAERNNPLMLSVRNIPNVKVITAAYLNPEDVLSARYLIFLRDAVAKAEEVFGNTRHARNAKSAKSESSHASHPSQSSKSTQKSSDSSPR